MTTPPPDKQPAAETLEQVAGRIVATLQERNNIILPDAGWLTESILSALRNEREHCATVALEQRCERGTPWEAACVAIAKAIREGGARRQ